MIRFLLIGLGLCCLTMVGLMVVSPWWRRIALGLLALLLARNFSMMPQDHSAAASDVENAGSVTADDVIEGEFRILDEK